MWSLQVRREKRYQDGAERGEKKDCKFCDDFGISAGKVDMRSLQVRSEKDIKTERRGGKKDCKFCDDFGVSAGKVDMRSSQGKT